MTGDLPPEQVNARAKADSVRQRFAVAPGGPSGMVHQRWVSVPRRLYHYTTIDGFAGIVSGSAIWVSDVRFMNDSTELTYAAELIESAVIKVLEESKSRISEIVLKHLHSISMLRSSRVRPYVACFCEEPDLLSQWRGYGRGSAPVSLGLDLSWQSDGGLLPQKSFLRKVIYEPDDQIEAVRSVVGTWLEICQEAFVGDGEDPGLVFVAVQALRESLLEHHLTFKHPAFREEREWRLIKLVGAAAEFREADRQRWNDALATYLQQPIPPMRNETAEGLDIKFRRSAIGMLPYLELDLREIAGPNMGRLPLYHVVQGPCPDPKLSLEALSLFLESRGYGSPITDIEQSRVPLR